MGDRHVFPRGFLRPFWPVCSIFQQRGDSAPRFSFGSWLASAVRLLQPASGPGRLAMADVR